jgi:predicted Zn-dependent peptidase
LRDVEEWPARIERVSAEDVIAAARRWLVHKPAVTGHLTPLIDEAA